MRGRTGCLELPGAMLAVYRLSEDEIVLFDSGREASPELLEWLEEQHLRVNAVVCTHLHEDHIANNAALVKQHGAQIYASAKEIEDVATERFADPLQYAVTPIGADVLEIGGAQFRLLPTAGHTAGHLAFVTPDDVCCVGDAIMTHGPLEKSKIPYMDDVDGSIVSAELLRQSDYPLYVVAHAGVVSREELSDLVEENIQKELELYDLLRRQIPEPTELEVVTDRFIRAAGVQSQKMLETDYVRHTAKVRIFALVRAGEFALENGWIVPLKPDKKV